MYLREPHHAWITNPNSRGSPSSSFNLWEFKCHLRCKLRWHKNWVKPVEGYWVTVPQVEAEQVIVREDERPAELKTAWRGYHLWKRPVETQATQSIKSNKILLPIMLLQADLKREVLSPYPLFIRKRYGY